MSNKSPIATHMIPKARNPKKPRSEKEQLLDRVQELSSQVDMLQSCLDKRAYEEVRVMKEYRREQQAEALANSLSFRLCAWLAEVTGKFVLALTSLEQYFIDRNIAAIGKLPDEDTDETSIS